MVELSFQNLFDIVSESIPSEWKKLIIHALCNEKSAEIKYYVQNSSDEYIDCFDLGCREEHLLQIIRQLHDEIIPARESLEEKKRWNGITVIIRADGEFLADYDYEDEICFSEEYRKIWRKKYLVS